MRIRRLAAVVCLLSMIGCDSSEPVELPASTLTPVGSCDLQLGCRAGDAGMSIRVQTGAPPRALKAFPVRADTTGADRIEAIAVTFIMDGMAMGLNRYRMLADGPGEWRADVILPICVSGRSDWVAEFEVRGVDRRAVLKVPFVLEKPVD